MNTEQNTEIKAIAETLFSEFKAIAIPPKATAQVVKRSEVSLSRDRAAGIGIPSTKLGKGNGSDRVLYNIYDIARFIVSRKQKVMS